MRGVPDTHLGAQLVRRDPLREHTRARRITAALEILVEHYRDAHHEDEHVDELRAFVDAGDEVAEVHAEAEAEDKKETRHGLEPIDPKEDIQLKGRITETTAPAE